MYRLTEPKHQGMSHLGNKFFNQTLREIRGARCRYIDQNARCEVDPFGRCAPSRGCSRLDENISFSPRGWILSTECPCVRGIYERERERERGGEGRGKGKAAPAWNHLSRTSRRETPANWIAGGNTDGTNQRITRHVYSRTPPAIRVHSRVSTLVSAWFIRSQPSKKTAPPLVKLPYTAAGKFVRHRRQIRNSYYRNSRIQQALYTASYTRKKCTLMKNDKQRELKARDRDN